MTLRIRGAVILAQNRVIRCRAAEAWLETFAGIMLRCLLFLHTLFTRDMQMGCQLILLSASVGSGKGLLSVDMLFLVALAAMTFTAKNINGSREDMARRASDVTMRS